jgi:SMC interacting uncharacterized protein involved in chromosome segregation
MRIILEGEENIVYDMKDVIRKILYVLKEDQSLNFGPRMKSSKLTKKNLEESIAKKRQLLEKSGQTLHDLKSKLTEMKNSDDNLRAELLEQLGSEL